VKLQRNANALHDFEYTFTGFHNDNGLFLSFVRLCLLIWLLTFNVASLIFIVATLDMDRIFFLKHFQRKFPRAKSFFMT
tara:strand:+ start:652 stop:888 length:237 start_codon:yes stop_codon:yes gene_type:complete